MLSAIYSKPVEFWWQVKEIQVMNPIQRISVMTNEVKCRMHGKTGFNIEDYRTQRTTVYLKDVYYRVMAEIVPRPGMNVNGIVAQAKRRIERGQCFTQPYMGLSECVCEFGPPDPTKRPLSISRDMNLMVYDMFAPWNDPDGKLGPQTSLYHCVMENGIIRVPDHDDPRIIKLQGGANIA